MALLNMDALSIVIRAPIIPIRIGLDRLLSVRISEFFHGQSRKAPPLAVMMTARPAASPRHQG